MNLSEMSVEQLGKKLWNLGTRWQASYADQETPMSCKDKDRRQCVAESDSIIAELARRIVDADGPKSWADDVPLAGPNRPKNDGSTRYLIEYLLTVLKRFGNTCVTADLQWGATALHMMTQEREQITALRDKVGDLKESLRLEVIENENLRLRLAGQTEKLLHVIKLLTTHADRLDDYCMGGDRVGDSLLDIRASLNSAANEVR